jgi:hypothetical protein
MHIEDQKLIYALGARLFPGLPHGWKRELARHLGRSSGYVSAILAGQPMSRAAREHVRALLQGKNVAGVVAQKRGPRKPKAAQPAPATAPVPAATPSKVDDRRRLLRLVSELLDLPEVDRDFVLTAVQVVAS